MNDASTQRVVEDLAVVAAGVEAEHQRSGVRRAELAVGAHQLIGDQLAVIEEVDLVVLLHPHVHVDIEWVIGSVDRAELRRGLGDRDRLRRVDGEAGRVVPQFGSMNSGAATSDGGATAALAVAGAAAQARTVTERSARISRRMCW